MIFYFKQLLNKDHRSFGIQINTILNIIFRGGGVLCSFLIVPITLEYLDQTNYGVWLTLSSIISWMSFMDVGLGNGLRNKLTEAISQNDNTRAKEYISTTYVIFAILVLFVLLAFSIINPFLNWNQILKSDLGRDKLLILTYIVFSSFCLRTILDLSGIIVTALHKPFIKSMVDFAINVLTLVSVYCLSKVSSPSLLAFSSVICTVPVLILIIFSWYLFNKRSRYGDLSPSFKWVKKKHITSLFNLGVQFFIIQIAGLIVFSTDNILITQLFSPLEVTAFNIAYKYFSIITFGFSILLLPYWSAFTSAFLKQDILWIKGAFKSLFVLWLIQVLAVVLLIFFANNIYSLWVGDKVIIANSINIMLGVYVILFNWNNIFAYFLNGISKIRIQLLSAVVLGILNIPLSFYLAKFTQLGVSSIILANCICLFLVSFWAPIQCYKIITGKAAGLWNK